MLKSYYDDDELSTKSDIQLTFPDRIELFAVKLIDSPNQRYAYTFFRSKTLLLSSLLFFSSLT